MADFEVMYANLISRSSSDNCIRHLQKCIDFLKLGFEYERDVYTHQKRPINETTALQKRPVKETYMGEFEVIQPTLFRGRAPYRFPRIRFSMCVKETYKYIKRDLQQRPI